MRSSDPILYRSRSSRSRIANLAPLLAAFAVKLSLSLSLSFALLVFSSSIDRSRERSRDRNRPLALRSSMSVKRRTSTRTFETAVRSVGRNAPWVGSRRARVRHASTRIRAIVGPVPVALRRVASIAAILRTRFARPYGN